MFDAQLLLFLFMPRAATVSDLPNGASTLSDWFSSWSLVDSCPNWDGIWLALMYGLAKRSPPGSFAWGSHLRFMLSRVKTSTAGTLHACGCGFCYHNLLPWFPRCCLHVVLCTFIIFLHALKGLGLPCASQLGGPRCLRSMLAGAPVLFAHAGSHAFGFNTPHY